MENKIYKLLTFNHNYADEHDVPALQCFTEEEYKEWLNKKISNPTENYEKKLEKYNEDLKKYNNYVKESTIMFSKKTPETHQNYLDWASKNRVEFPKYVKKGKSLIDAYLGNNGECFGEDFDQYLTPQELIDDGIVEVYDVDESFYNTFHKVQLDKLSLCNIFSNYN